jgi:hypothetical protein
MKAARLHDFGQKPQAASPADFAAAAFWSSSAKIR